MSFIRSVSIPQAVSTVATGRLYSYIAALARFNTASGKYCCNPKIKKEVFKMKKVSIPQAVSTVATNN